MTREEKIDKLIDMLAELGLIVITDGQPDNLANLQSECEDIVKSAHTS